MPRLKECYLEKASTFNKAKPGVGCDGIHAKVSLHLTRNKRKCSGILGEVEQAGNGRNKLARRCSFDTEECHK